VYSSASTVRVDLVEKAFGEVGGSKLLIRRALIFLTLDRGGGGGGEFAERTVPNFRRNGRVGCGIDQVKKME
jgi:hypothetical protein